MTRRRELSATRGRVYDRSGHLLEVDDQVLVRTRAGWVAGVVAGFDDGGNVAVRLAGRGSRRARVWAFPIDVDATRQGSLFGVDGVV